MASAPVIATGATDLNTRTLQIAESLAKLALGTTNVTTWAAAINGLAATANVQNHDTLLGATTSKAAALASLGGAARGANTDIISLGSLTALTVTGTSTLSTSTFTAGSATTAAGNFRGAAADPAQTIFAVQNNAGTVNNLTVDNTGAVVARGTVTAPTFSGAFSGNATTASGGPASGLTGTLLAATFPALTGDVTTAAGSLATTVAAIGGSTAANVHAAELATNAATTVNTASTIVKRDASGNFTAGTITAALTGSVSGTAANITGVLNAASHPALTGDVTTVQGALATTVALVGGSTAANIHAAELLANAATNLNTVSTIVKRDPSGNFTAGTITATLSGTATNITGVLTAASHPALTGDVTVASGTLTTTVATVGGSSAANVHTAELAANAATNLNTVSTLVKRDASGNFTAGTITATLSGTATNITGVLTAASHPALTGDVTVASGTTTTTVAIVGGSSAANVNAATLLANAATNLNAASAIVKRDASGNFTAGTITATLAGNATNVTGTVSVANGGTGQTGATPGGLLLGNSAGTGYSAFVGSVNGQVALWNGSAWTTGSVVVPDHSVTTQKLGDGAVVPVTPPSMSVYVNALKKYDGAGNPVQWSGGSIDLTSYVPGSGTSVWVMIYLNATAAVYAAAGAASATPTKPQAIGGQTPLAYILLYAGQITVQVGDIYDWRTDFAAYAIGGGTGSGYSAVGHIHGQGGESFVAVSATDEGRPTTPNVAGMTVYVQPTRYSDTNSVVQQFPGGASATIAKPVSFPYYVAVGLSQAGAVTLNYGAENATPVRGQFLNSTDIPLAYVLVRTGSTRTILNDDSVNALIIDARRPYTFSSPAAGGITPVSSGGTGQSAFPTGTGLLFTTGGTGVLQTAPATIGTPTVGFGLNPTVTPAGANADLFQGGGGVVATGTTSIAGTVTGMHIMASTKTGTGTIGTFNALTIEAQTIGTTNNSLNVVGNAAVSGNLTVGGGLTFNSNLVITAATAVVAQFNSNSAAGIVEVVNGAASATGLLTSWRVNGVEQANIGPGGVVTAKGVTNSGNETIGGTLGVTGATTLAAVTATTGSFSATLGVTGVATFSTSVIAPTVGPVAAQQHTLPAVASDTVAVLVAAQILTNKTLTAPAITNPAITGGGSLAGTFSGTPTFSGALTLSAAATALSVTNNVTVGGTLAVTGATTLAAVGATNGTFSGTLGVTGATTLSGGGSLAGTFSGPLTLSGAVTLSAAGTALSVTNNATIGGTLQTTGTVGFGTALDSNNALSIGGTITSTTGNARGILVSSALVPAANNSAYGIAVSALISAAATTTYPSAAGLRIAPISKTGTGTVTNAYGAFIATPSAGTNNYALAFDAPAGAIQQEAWTAPTLLNSWVNNGGADITAGYYRDTDGTVHLRGKLKSGLIGSACFNLPAGYQPSAAVNFAVNSNNAFGSMYIASTGDVVPYVGSNIWFALDGATFDTRA